jgi:FdhD protein
VTSPVEPARSSLRRGEPVRSGRSPAEPPGSNPAEPHAANRVPAEPPAANPAPLDPELPVRHVTSTKIVAVRGAELEVRDDLVVGEEPLEIRAAGPRQDPVSVAVTMRTPGYEDELAIGFLTSEGLLRDNEVLSVRYGDPGVMAEPDDSVLVRLAHRFDPALVAQRNFVATASCGICGKASIDDVAVRCEPLPHGLPVVARSVIVSLPDRLREAQAAFERTGGLHAAGLFETDGRLVAIREDVGRHNALDKLIGSRVRARELPLWDRILLVSGRVSFEIVQKAAVAGVAVVCAVSAPSDLAIRLADRLGVTLVGFLRGDGFNVYSHDGRIDLRDLLG